jgi:hypothetical protein
MAASPPFADERAPFPFRTWLGVILLFVVFGLVVAVLVRIAPRGNTYEAKRAAAREEKLKTLMDEAHQQLTTYGWVDKSKGVARIPIERAMQLALADLAQKKPTPAAPIETPAPAQATASGANPPSPTPSAPPPQGTAAPKLPSREGPKNPEIRGQPAGAANPPNAQPATQPGASATPAAAPPPPSGQAPVSPSVTPVQSSHGTPIPVAGKTPPPTS